MAPVVQSRLLKGKTMLQYVPTAVGIGKLQSRLLLQDAPSNWGPAGGTWWTHQTEFPYKKYPYTIIVNSTGGDRKVGSGSTDKQKL